MAQIQIYSDTAKGCILFDNSRVEPKFLGTIQATAHDTISDRIVIVRLDRENSDGSFRKLFKRLKITRVQNEAGQDLVATLGYTRDQVINYINTEASATGGSASGSAPVITSSSSIALTTGDTLNYELVATYGVGYEWSNLPSGVVTVEGNVRKLIGGSSLAEGTYNISAKAINYFGEATQTVALTVSNPPFQDSKSVFFDTQDYMGANAALATALERASNGSGASDAWTVSFWIKPANSTNGQCLFYFGNNDTTNNGYIEIRQVATSKIRLRYGSGVNYIQIQTDADTLTHSQWNHVMVTYDGGTTGSSSGSLSSYYNRFKILIDGLEPTRTTSHSNYGWSGAIVGQNLRLGKFVSGNTIRGGYLDEVSVHPADLSSDASNIYNSGSPRDLESFSPDHWWRMGDGDTYPNIQDASGTATMVMYNMTAANIVTDVP